MSAMNWLNGWMKSVPQTIAAHRYYQKISLILEIFFNAENNKEVAKKSASVAVGYAVYSYLDWKIVALGFVLVDFMLDSGFGFWAIFLFMWLVGMLLYVLIIIASDRSGRDFTLAGGQRRLVNKLFVRSKVLGIIAEVLMGITHVAWTGMAQFHIFFRDRFPRPLSYLLFIVLSGTQMYIWVHVYIRGINVIKYLWQFLAT